MPCQFKKSDFFDSQYKDFISKNQIYGLDAKISNRIRTECLESICSKRKDKDTDVEYCTITVFDSGERKKVLCYIWCRIHTNIAYLIAINKNITYEVSALKKWVNFLHENKNTV